jgi:hypothetical protein
MRLLLLMGILHMGIAWGLVEILLGEEGAGSINFQSSEVFSA